MIRSIVVPLALIALLLPVAPTPAAAAEGDLELRRLLRAALLRAHLERGQVASWRRRIAWAALLPRVSGRVYRSTGEGSYQDLRPDRPISLDLNNRVAFSWEIRATWDLGRLVFDARELQAAASSQQLARRREAVIDRVVELVHRRRWLAGLVRQGEATSEDRLELQALTARLDALTGGVLTAPQRTR